MVHKIGCWASMLPPCHHHCPQKSWLYRLPETLAFVYQPKFFGGPSKFSAKLIFRPLPKTFKGRNFFGRAFFKLSNQRGSLNLKGAATRRSWRRILNLPQKIAKPLKTFLQLSWLNFKRFRVLPLFLNSYLVAIVMESRCAANAQARLGHSRTLRGISGRSPCRFCGQNFAKIWQCRI